MNENLKRALNTFPIPGRAQISSGAKTRGIIYMTVFIIAIVLLFYNFVAALQTRAQTIDAMADISESGDAKQEVDISGSTMPFMIIMLIIYIIAFIDAYKLCGETKGADHE